MKRILIDTDPGIDDAAAILMALASPELEVVALTTIFGNSSVEVCTANARRVLAAASRSDIPVYLGAGKPLLRPANEGWASHIHGGDGLGGIAGDAGDGSQARNTEGKHAALAIIEAVMATPGEITVLALGRMTNLALAMSLEPGLAGCGTGDSGHGRRGDRARQRLRRGDGQPARGPRGRLHRLPLRRTHRAGGAGRLQPGDRQPLTAGSHRGTLGQPATRLLSEATGHLREAYIRTGRIGPDDGVRYNDMPAIGYAIDPGLFTARSAYVEIETHSELTKGQTVADWNAAEPNARICLEVDAEALTALFTERLATGFRVN